MQGAKVPDIRDQIFAGLGERQYIARLTATMGGVLAGVAAAEEHGRAAGLQLEWAGPEGRLLAPGDVVVTVTGTARAIALGEERLPACLCKASGIATSARKAVELAAGRVRVVSGAWKKMPPELKGMVRRAVEVGGMPTRIVDGPFLYLDKNYVRMLGGIRAALAAVEALDGVRVIQVRGEEAPIAEETVLACQGGAGVVMVDTGNRQDAIAALAAAAAYPTVRIAFAGRIRHEDIPALADLGIHILDIGTAVVDAPLLDMKLDVMGMQG
ncbi:MAG: quinolinate phosphoribosyl transferase [Anaerolineae bacterium]